MFASLQDDSAKRAPQFELNGFVTMATYWVADLLKIKGITGHLRPGIPFSYLQMLPHIHDLTSI